MEENRIGIYVHVPFCMSRCPYCDFYKVVGKTGGGRRGDDTAKLKTKYIEALKREVDSRLKDISPICDTVYFGGGTPNFLEATEICEILTWFKPFFPKDIEPEISMEYNPKVRKEGEEEYLMAVREAGINRLSIGAQSFDDSVLLTLGRAHRASDTEKSFELARKAGFGNISLDLMFGVPGMNLDSWEKSLAKAIELSPEHISAYSLEFMEGTKFTSLRDSGRLAETTPELDREMYHMAIERLGSAGLRQYEISNFAEKGFESGHNLKYWSMDEYLGFGPSAHSFAGGKRWESAGSIEEYIENPELKNIYEEVGLRDAMSEFIFTGLRKTEGIRRKDFVKRFGMDVLEAFPEAAEELEGFIRSGDAALDTEVLRITLSGLDISNKIMCLFV